MFISQRSGFIVDLLVENTIQAGLVALLDSQMNITLKEFRDFELIFMKERNFNLLVPTTTEFAWSMIGRLEATTAGADLVSSLGLDAEESLLLEKTYAWAEKYIRYLEHKFENLEYRQSEKALVVANCAVARWSIMQVDLLD